MEPVQPGVHVFGAAPRVSVSESSVSHPSTAKSRVASAPSSDVTVTIVSADANLATANESTVTFTASSYGPRTVRVVPVDDSGRTAWE